MPKPKIKVALLSFYSGLVSRGVETFVSELASHVSDKVDLRIYHGDTLPGPGNKLHYLFLDPPARAIKKFSHRILAKLAADPPDILMALNNGWMSWLAKRFCRRYKTKLVLAGLSGIGWDDKVNLWLKPDCFVVCTNYQAKWAGSINKHVRVKTINIGVNTDRFRPAGPKLRHGLKPPVVLVVAGPEKTKRVHLAVKAASRINAALLVVGRQPEAINRQAKALLGDRYKNILISYDRLDAVYRSVQVYTLPSGLSEAYGISILEALASGLPVVVNNDPIRRELAGRAGILVDPADSEAYPAALAKAIKASDPAASRAQAERFSWEKISRQYLDLWSGLI